MVNLAHKMRRTWDRARWRLLRAEVFALVGKSGTGKSFRAALIADKYGIEAIIDDGLLISEGKIIAGQSAKREAHYVAATKTACFFDLEHRREVRSALKERRIRRVLLLGTSERMIRKNCEMLGLPYPHKIIRIEDIATQEEIATAIHERSKHGRHVIPLPIIEVQRSYPRMIAESLTVWLSKSRRLFGNKRPVEKTVVRPEFARKGGVTISEAVLSQMVLHCVDELTPDLSVAKIKVRQSPKGCEIKLVLGVPLGRELSASLHYLRETIMTEIENYTGIYISKLALSVEDIREKQKS